MKLKKGKAVEKMAKTHVARKKKKKNLAEVTTDDFFNQDFENMDISDNEEVKEEKESVKVVKQNTKKIEKGKKTDNGIVSKKEGSTKVNSKKEKSPMSKKSKGDEEKQSDDNDMLLNMSDLDSDSDDELTPAAHRKALQNLQETDPEFYNYLKQNDAKLLDFNVDDDAAESGDETESKHIPANHLEIPSDESDYEPEDAEEKTVHTGSKTKVTLQLIKTWQQEIQTDKSSTTIKTVVEAFHAALETVSDSEVQTTRFKVDGGAIFNEIVQLCIIELPAAFKRFLNIGEETRFEAHKAKRFPKIRKVIKNYLIDLLQVFQNISSANIITTLLKHLHQLLPFSLSFSSLRKPLLRNLLKYWSTGEEETIRIVAFMCIIKIALSKPAILDNLLKIMYIKYVENARFVSPTTLPGINFMRRSLVETYMIDSEQSYYHAFLYVRQLAIHLRNALTLKKKEHFQAIYNWQYINSLWFWSELISASKSHSALRNLLYPLVQITLGVALLIPTMQYYPLRFHCVKMLINIAKETGVFIPSVPLLIEILDNYDFNKRHKVVSMKPMSLMCILRVSKKQSRENAYKDAIIENVYELFLEHAAMDSHTIYFPDQYVFSVVKLKAFLKKCNVANYCRKMKQLLDKIEENRKFIEQERKKRTFDLFDLPDIERWETQIKQAGTPIAKFYNSWYKLHEAQKLKLLTQNDNEAQYDVPGMKKSKRGKRRGREDDSENSDLEIPVEEMDRKLKKQKEAKKAKKQLGKKPRKAQADEEADEENDKMDEVRDIKGDDW